MEEILCIGCGATIPAEDKTGLVYTPQVSIGKKVWKTGEVYYQRCSNLRPNEITDVVDG